MAEAHARASFLIAELNIQLNRLDSAALGRSDIEQPVSAVLHDVALKGHGIAGTLAMIKQHLPVAMHKRPNDL